MTLYRKTVLAIGVTLGALILVVYGVSQVTLLTGFEQAEMMSTATNVQRAYWALMTEMRDLESLAVDWSRWDETLQFVTSGNPSYVDSNLMPSTFRNLKLDLVLLLNRQQEIVFQRLIEPELGIQRPLSPDLEAHLLPGGRVVTHLTKFSRVTGFIEGAGGILYVVSVPILDSNGQGPIGGTLIFGRFILPEHLATIQQQIRLRVGLQPFHSLNLAPDYAAAKTTLAAGSQSYIKPLDERNIAGFQIIDDVNGQPAILLRVEMGRAIYQQGQISMSYFLTVLAITGVCFAAVVLFLLDRGVLRRLHNLSAAVSYVSATGDLKAPIRVGANDELTSLAEGVKSMLDALAASRFELETANKRLYDANDRLIRLNDDLDRRVSERTYALAEVNNQLRQEIAERQQAQNLLAQARDQALEALRVKNQILANVSHDARTPLTSIILHAELLQRGSYGEIAAKQKDKLSNVLISARQLMTFINNMLGEAQMTNGKLWLADEPFAPTHLLADVTSIVQPLAERKKLQFSTEVEAALPYALRGDCERLKQVVTNLIDNAIKFTDRGDISVRMFKRDDAHWVIEVKDTGRGIPAEAQGHIFEAFWQVDGSVTRDANRGVGLGLSIVKQLVSLMNGEITLISAPEQGTTFTVVLPLILPHPQTSLISSEIAAATSVLA